METLHTSVGRLRYAQNSFWLCVDVNQDIANMYLALLPKAWQPQRPKWPAHITVVRDEPPPNEAAWKKYDGQPLEFYYLSGVKQGKIYWWLDVYCKQLEEIRLELGLPVVNLFEPPLPGFRKRFHMTIANCKDK